MGKFDGGMRSGTSMVDKQSLNNLIANKQYSDAIILMKSIAAMNNLELPPVPLEIYEEVLFPSHFIALRNYVFDNFPKLSGVWGDKITQFGRGANRIKIAKFDSAPKKTKPTAPKGAIQID